MTEKFIITIGRQFGSGGRVIGKELAKRLGFDYYDKELLNEAARVSGLDCSCFEEADEKELFSIPNILTSNWFSFGLNDGSMSSEYIFKCQSEVIQMIAEKGNCVLVGRCADYVLRDMPNCLNIFLHAPLEARIQRVMARDKISEKEATNIVKRHDKQRSSYYNFFTDKTWGDGKSYHFSIDSSLLGISETCDIICSFVNKYKSSLLK
ncbi:MAG: cytidylate kinase-like family protein [Bacteroidales bacterium]|nr:cytidylate kinase-like family protein [Bacteroidales bacterium]